METEHINPDYTQEIITLLRKNLPAAELAQLLEQYHDRDIADAFGQLDADERRQLYHSLGPKRISEILSYLEEPSEYLQEIDPDTVADILENMDSDDAVDVLEQLDTSVSEQIIDLMDDESSKDIELIRSYDEDEIGSKMTTNFIQIRNTLTIKQAMRSLVAQAEENDNISTIYVCDDEERFCGAIDLTDLIIARQYTELSSLISTSYPYVTDHQPISECLERIKDYAEDSIPVLNEEHKILGVITAQDIVEVVDEEMGEDYAKFAGLTEEEDLNEPLRKSMGKRLPWLIILLALGICVSSVVGMFETVVSQIAIIVCFQSLILDMAGNVGTQSLAVTIRVLMDEQLRGKQKAHLVLKEMRVGLCNGLLLGSVSVLLVGLYVAFLKGKPIFYAFAVSGCVGASLVVSMMISALLGTVIPMFFHRIHVDPAVASGPLITTVNDLVAVLSYYGLAWLLLIQCLHVVG